MTTHSSILAWKISWREESGGLQSMGVTKSWTRWSTHTQTHTHTNTHSHRVEYHYHSSKKEVYLFIGEGNDNPLQYSCLENSMDRRAWQFAVHGVAESRTRRSN